MNKLSDLKEQVTELETINARLRTERDMLNARVNAVVAQLGEALRNKAQLELQLRFRIAVPEAKETPQ
jgi:regulator of replication initiation timing